MNESGEGGEDNREAIGIVLEVGRRVIGVTEDESKSGREAGSLTTKAKKSLPFHFGTAEKR